MWRRLLPPVCCAGVGLLAIWLGGAEAGRPDARVAGFVRSGGVVVLVMSLLAVGWVLLAPHLPGAHGAGVGREDLRRLAPTRAELAARLGWEVRNTDPRLLAWARTGILAEGTERRANHVLTGLIDGWRFAVFEYIRRMPGADEPIGTTVWMVMLPAPAPPFEVSVEEVDPPVRDLMRAGGLVRLQAEGATLLTYHPGFASGGGPQAIVVARAEALVALARALSAPGATSTR
ncbi:hypothetical protein [Dactylosporangium sp. CA-233914]|uniref:hypothetical protein n=1 Tax=Dactylosporangium sp. CA-233914 TaxID=3239934 RepID=UPI003D93B4A5